MQHLLLTLATALATLGMTSPPPPHPAQRRWTAPTLSSIVAGTTWAYSFLDLGCYGNTIIETPRLDAMAAGGIKFTAAYCAAPICSPSRQAIQTGLHPARTGMSEHLRGTPVPRDCQPRIAPPNAIRTAYAYRTIGEAMRDQDYRTLYIGKWHLGGAFYGPMMHGYDLSYAAGPQGLPNSFFRPFFGGDRYPELNTIAGDDDYLTDAITTLAISELPDGPDEQAFFMDLNYYSPHVPIEGPPELVAKYEQRVAEAGVRFPEPEYAAMVETIDAQVGRLVDTLEARGLLENTVILFTSDHGALTVEEVPAFAQHTPPTDSGPLRDGKGYIYEGGLRVPLIAYAPGRFGPDENSLPNTNLDYFPTITALGGTMERTVDSEPIPALTDAPIPTGDRTLYFHFPTTAPQRGQPAAAVIEGDDKFIQWYSDVDSTYYFDLAQDPGEANPASADDVARAQVLRGKLRSWQDTVGARFMTVNPNFDGSDCN